MSEVDHLHEVLRKFEAELEAEIAKYDELLTQPSAPFAREPMRAFKQGLEWALDGLRTIRGDK